MFDGREDVRRQSVINIMLKVDSGMNGTENHPFMIGTEYSGARKLGAADYLQIVEKTLDSYQIGDRVCAITSDNTQSCINTRQMFASRNRGSFSVNDQSHVADLLIENVSELGWMATVIDKVLSLWCIATKS